MVRAPLRLAGLGLCLVATSGCQLRGPIDYLGEPTAMDALIAAARGCGVRHMRIDRSAPGETRVRGRAVRVGSRDEAAIDCLARWINAHPELDIREVLIIRG